jgi:DNA-binding MarR family transcriptional regulator
VIGLWVGLARGRPRTDNDAVRNSETDLEGMPMSRLLSLAGHVVAIQWRQVMGRHGLTPHGLAVLDYLEQGQALTQRELARRCGVAPSTLNHTVDHLQRSGWIERQRHEADRRLVRLALTASGHRQLADTRRMAHERVESLFDHLDPALETTVRRFLVETVVRIQVTEA